MNEQYSDTRCEISGECMELLQSRCYTRYLLDDDGQLVLLLFHVSEGLQEKFPSEHAGTLASLFSPASEFLAYLGVETEADTGRVGFGGAFACHSVRLRAGYYCLPRYALSGRDLAPSP